MEESTIIGYAIYEITRTADGIAVIETTLNEELTSKFITDVMVSNPTAKSLSLESESRYWVLRLVSGGTDANRMAVLVAEKQCCVNLAPFIAKSKELADKINFTDYQVLSRDEALAYLSSFDNLDSLLFAAIANCPVIAIGDEVEVRTLFFSLVNLLSPFVGATSNVVTMADTIDEKIQFIGLEPTEETLSTIDEFADTHTIVSMKKKLVVPLYKSTMSTHLAEAIKMKEETLITDILTTVNIIARRNIDAEDELTIADNENLPMDDAMLIHGLTTRLKKFNGLSQSNTRSGGT